MRSRRGDGDLMSFVAARWPSLVREAVRLGCPEEQAPDLVLDALAHCQRDWAQTRATADVDAEVEYQLVESFRRWQRSSARSDQPEPVRVRSEDLDELVVLAPPELAQIDGHRRAYERRRLIQTVRIAVPVLLAVALVSVGLSWLSGRGDDQDALTRLQVRPVGNRANLVWEADGQVHLPRGVVGLSGVVQLDGMDGGAVYEDRTGRIVALDATGRRELLGHTEPGARFVASDEQGWVVWVERGSTQRLVVYDVVGDRRVARGVVDRHPRPIAIDDDTVWYANDAGARGWQPAAPTPATEVVEPAQLLDVQSRIRAYQVSAGTVRLVPPIFDTATDIAGVGARLSADGRFVVTSLPAHKGVPSRIAVYDTASGRQLDTGVGPDETALVATPGPHGTVSYVVARAVGRPVTGNTLELRTCTIRPPTVPAVCRTVTNTIPYRAVPVLSG